MRNWDGTLGEKMQSRVSLSSKRWQSLIVGAVIVVEIVAAASIVVRPMDRVAEYPLTEDGYYSLAVARNMALGKGPSADGISLTNGFQPLFTVLSSSAYLISSGRFTALRYILLFHWLLWIITGFLLANVARTVQESIDDSTGSLVFWFTLLIYLGSITIFLNHFNGLETGLLLFFYSLAWLFYKRKRFDTLRDLVVMGVILGLAVLTRIDTVFVVITLSAYEIVRWWRTDLLRGIFRFLILGGVAFAVSMPWWAYNLLYFHSIMPSSGKATQLWTASWERILIAVVAVFKTICPVQIPSLEGVGDIFRAGISLSVSFLVVRYLQERNVIRLEGASRRTIGLRWLPVGINTFPDSMVHFFLICHLLLCQIFSPTSPNIYCGDFPVFVQPIES